MTASTPGTARIAFFTDRHCAVADLAVGAQRASDVLNDRNRSVLVLERVQLTRPAWPDQPVDRVARLILRKEAIQCALVLVEPPRPAERRISAYAPKAAVAVVLMLPGLWAAGRVHVIGGEDALRFVLEGAQQFLPLTDARVTPVAEQLQAIGAPVVLINRGRIEAVGIAP